VSPASSRPFDWYTSQFVLKETLDGRLVYDILGEPRYIDERE
jgi:hypothetical protein